MQVASSCGSGRAGGPAWPRTWEAGSPDTGISFQRSHGILLGVVGSDVALRELMKLAPRYKVSLDQPLSGVTGPSGATSVSLKGGHRP